MNVEKREKIIVDWINNYCDTTSFEPKSLVVGISGGIDSSVVSTLCALTKRKTIVLSMPIKQIKSQHDLSIEHANWLMSKFKNVEHKILELENVLGELFIHQGKSERIKNFPYPRQYASLAYYLVKLFVVLLPFGIVSEFADIAKYISIDHSAVGSYFIWLSVPFCACVSWAFHIMERMARIGENPFEGGPNDVPISTISRGIEIDLREMLDENKNDIPGQFPEDQNVQM